MPKCYGIGVSECYSIVSKDGDYCISCQLKKLKEELSEKNAKIEQLENDLYHSSKNCFVIDKDWFVYRVDADHKDPYIKIANNEKNEEIWMSMPEQLAYYLQNHFCGSGIMRKKIQEEAVRGLRAELRKLLGMEDD